MANVWRAGPPVLLVLLLAALLAAYPLAPWAMAVALILYSLALWRWPGLWLVAIPAGLPLLDLAPWTGWLLIGEQDFFLLATVAVLWLRAPPRAGDFLPHGPSGWIIGAYAVVHLLAMARGLLLPGPAEGTANIYLSPLNSVRAGKALLSALALLPFLHRRQMEHGDVLTRLGLGIVLGLLSVAGPVIAERLAFPGLLNVTADYRVVASFSSMHIGGGHIGAWLAFSLPFLVVPLLRLRVWSVPLVVLAGVVGVYALVVTFARTAYAAALVGAVVVTGGLAVGVARQARRLISGLLLPMLVMGVAGAGIVTAALDSGYMAGRFAQVAPDFSERARNWTQGLGLRDRGIFTVLFGMGLGTYPRLVHARAPDWVGPSNFTRRADGDVPVLALQARGPFYLGQKVSVQPGDAYRVSFRLRARVPRTTVSFGLCEKWLLYSEICATNGARPTEMDKWEFVSATLVAPGTVEQAAARWVARPIEFYLHVPPGGMAEVADLRLRGFSGEELLLNGDFVHGTAHWYFTDDNHGSWRIFNQYATVFFESGLLGLLTFLALLAGAFRGTLLAVLAGDRAAACGAAAVAAFAVSCLFDAQLEAPRLAAIVYLLAFARLDGPLPASPGPARVSTLD